MNRPKLSATEARAIVAGINPAIAKRPVIILGIRGYYLRTMGDPKRNDRGIYDDAIFVLGSGTFASYNANTDPSIYRRGIASLCAGVWDVYRLAKHKGQYMALCQRGGPVHITRDGKGQEVGYFGINIHKGSRSSTSSEGCQTIYPDQWPEFIGRVTGLVKAVYGKDWQKVNIPYVLVEEKLTP